MLARHLAPLLALAALACDRADEKRPPQAEKGPVPVASAAPRPPEKVSVPAVSVSDQGATTVHVAWDVPAGTEVNDEAPFHLRWTTSEGLAEVPPEQRAKGRDVSTGFDVRVVPTKGAPEALLAGTVDLVVCDSVTHSVCVPVKRRVEMPFTIAKDAKARAEVRVALPQARPAS